AGICFLIASAFHPNRLLAIYFSNHVAKAFVAMTGSMSPTINPHDRVLANRLVPIRRWDVVVHHAPPESWRHLAEPESYNKRVIGLPGERIQIFNGQVAING